MTKDLLKKAQSPIKESEKVICPCCFNHLITDPKQTRRRGRKKLKQQTRNEVLMCLNDR